MKTKLVFCATEQKKTEHIVTIDLNGEYLFECPCGHFLKIPGEFGKADITSHLTEYKKANSGQVTQEAIEQEMAEKLKNV